jgi:hypothetical protein
MGRKKPHECKLFPQEAYILYQYTYAIVRLECVCGKEDWDIGEKVI